MALSLLGDRWPKGNEEHSMRTQRWIVTAASGALAAAVVGQGIAFGAATTSPTAANPSASETQKIIAQAAQPFEAPATSGSNELITGTWDGGCRQMSDGVWEHSSRTIYGHVLDWTWTDYANASTSPDCTDGPVDIIHAVQVFAPDGVSVPFSWSTSAGVPAAAPPGLGGAHDAIGMSAVVSSAVETPLTPARAAALDKEAFCGIHHWQAGITTDILGCFTGGLGEAPFKATLLVDDTSVPGEIVIYDGLGNPSATSYPALMPDDFDHHRDIGNVTP